MKTFPSAPSLLRRPPSFPTPFGLGVLTSAFVSLWMVVGASLLALTPRAQGINPNVLHQFAAQIDGTDPQGALVLAADGNFYGTTNSGLNGLGTVFRITPAGVETIAHAFQGTDGACPGGALALGSDGYLYGTTAFGGASNLGTVFKLATDGTFATLYTFSVANTDGSAPEGALVLGSDGFLYGTTSSGGTNGQGTVFKVSTAGTLTTLHSFGALDDNNVDGAQPGAELVQASDGSFYGTTPYSGTAGEGTVFRITATGGFTTLHTFGGTQEDDGAYPASGLVQGKDGNLYGTVPSGGTNGDGIVFKLSTSGVFVVLHAFDYTDGSGPLAGLVQGSDNAFYGTTEVGGADESGTVFKITADGTLSTLYSFSNGTDGAYPQARLFLNSDGAFYGTAPYDEGGHSLGTVFKLTADGDLTTLHLFSAANSDGIAPQTLLAGSDGFLYGTTDGGGANDNGVVFKLATDGSLTVLHDFSALDSNQANADGSKPVPGLAVDNAATLYGTTQQGGASGSGTVFQITADGTFTTLHTFTALDANSNTDGSSPGAGLTLGVDGFLYGTTPSGGPSGGGTVF